MADTVNSINLGILETCNLGYKFKISDKDSKILIRSLKCW